MACRKGDSATGLVESPSASALPQSPTIMGRRYVPPSHDPAKVRAQRTQSRLRKLRAIFPELPEDALERASLRRLSCAVRRCGKHQSALRESAGASAKNAEGAAVAEGGGGIETPRLFEARQTPAPHLCTQPLQAESAL